MKKYVIQNYYYYEFFLIYIYSIRLLLFSYLYNIRKNRIY